MKKINAFLVTGTTSHDYHNCENGDQLRYISAVLCDGEDRNVFVVAIRNGDRENDPDGYIEARFRSYLAGNMSKIEKGLLLETSEELEASKNKWKIDIEYKEKGNRLLRRRIEDALRKTATEEQLLTIAGLLGVKTE
ncbi:MAG: hypothetical protein ABIG73_01210 [Patescibacteria group bacterium]